MNKSLETEYKEQVRIDLPDLWGKIEEKLGKSTAPHARGRRFVYERPDRSRPDVPELIVRE